VEGAGGVLDGAAGVVMRVKEPHRGRKDAGVLERGMVGEGEGGVKRGEGRSGGQGEAAVWRRGVKQKWAGGGNERLAAATAGDDGDLVQ
jgi:hypothetical protein